MLIAVVRVYCCTRKLLKETETEQTIGFVSSFVSLIAFQLEGEGRAPWLRLTFNDYLPFKFALTSTLKFGITKLLKIIYRKKNTKLYHYKKSGITISLKTKNVNKIKLKRHEIANTDFFENEKKIMTCQIVNLKIKKS